MRTFFFSVGMTLLIFVFSQSKIFAQSNDFNWGIGLKAGTLGYGLEGSGQLTKNIDVRLGGVFYKKHLFGDDVTKLIGEPNSSGLNFTMDIKYQSAHLLFDFYQGDARLIRFTGGLLYSRSSISVTGNMNRGFDVNEVRVSPKEFGSINYKITANPINPYVGIGIGSNIPKKRKIGVSLDIGLVYMGSPKVELTATNYLEPTANQEQLLNDNLKHLTLFPAISLHINYKLPNL